MRKTYDCLSIVGAKKKIIVNLQVYNMMLRFAGYLTWHIEVYELGIRDSPSPLGSATNCARNQDAVTYRRKVVF